MRSHDSWAPIRCNLKETRTKVKDLFLLHHFVGGQNIHISSLKSCRVYHLEVFIECLTSFNPLLFETSTIYSK